jgi:Cys-tRNA(Pro)/Cys-tRNA(Cys) deacylase
MTTRGIQDLDQKGIAHELVKYDHREKGADFAARAVGFALAQTIKTLVVALDGDRYVLVLMPGDRQVSMKKVAALCGAKRAAMADTATAERLTGYLVGGISPFGVKRALPVVMDAAAAAYDRVMINAGRRGLMVKLAPSDIVPALAALVADVAV